MFHIHGYDSPINISIAQLRARDAKERKRHEKLLASQKASTANQIPTQLLVEMKNRMMTMTLTMTVTTAMTMT